MWNTLQCIPTSCDGRSQDSGKGANRMGVRVESTYKLLNPGFIPHTERATERSHEEAFPFHASLHQPCD